jgi:hypothetical protein
MALLGTLDLSTMLTLALLSPTPYVPACVKTDTKVLQWELLETKVTNLAPTIVQAYFIVAVVFAGGAPDLTRRANIYDDTTTGFSTIVSALSQPRAFMRYVEYLEWLSFIANCPNCSSVTVGNKIFFAGGRINPFMSNSGATKDVDSIVEVYDSGSDTWTAVTLPTPRAAFGFAAVSYNRAFENFC